MRYGNPFSSEQRNQKKRRQTGDKMKKINPEINVMRLVDGKTKYLDLDMIDEINENVSFVIAVLEAIGIIDLSLEKNIEIRERTLLNLASEAEKKMERIKEIINAN